MIDEHHPAGSGFLLHLVPRFFGAFDPVELEHQTGRGGLVVERRQECVLPTLERGRFVSPLAGDRMPPIADAWVVS